MPVTRLAPPDRRIVASADRTIGIWCDVTHRPRRLSVGACGAVEGRQVLRPARRGGERDYPQRCGFGAGRLKAAPTSRVGYFGGGNACSID
jgi:hypothetical protein